MPSQIAVFLAKHQSLLAFGALAVLVLELLGLYSLPPAANMAIAAFAGALGIQRPTEAASKIVGEVSAARGGVGIAAIVAALASAFAVVEPEQPPSPSGQGVEMAAEAAAVEPEPAGSTSTGELSPTSSGGSSSG